MKTLGWLFLIFVFIPNRKIENLPVDYETLIKQSVEFDNTIIYLWTPQCSPCIKELKKLKRIKERENQHLVLLTLKNQNLEVLKKFGFDTSYYFNPERYKTHTIDYDEFNQFTDEILKGKEIKNKGRAIYPAVFIINQKKELIYFSEDSNGKVDTSTIHMLLNM